MWVTAKLLDLFHISRDTVDDLRQELAAVRAERDGLFRELTSCKINADWLRLQANSLQLERTGFIQKLYGIQLPAPQLLNVAQELLKAPKKVDEFTFEDIGDEAALEHGYETYDLPRGMKQ